MLSDYKRYLLKIRNSFIRSGVELDIKDIQDYEEIFYLGEKLSDLLWFYSVLEISGSEDRLRGFMFPLNSHYSSSIRDKYFEDYLIFKAGYMDISASDAIKRNKLNEVKKEETFSPKEETPFIPSTVSFLEGIKSRYNDEEEEEDEFIGESDSYDEEEEVFSNWGSDDDEELEYDEFISHDSYEEDEFASEEDDEISDDYELEDDEFINYGGEDTSEELEDDEFVSYGSSDEEYDEYLDDEDTSFGTWGNLEDIVEESEDSVEEPLEEEDVFGSWGSSDEEEPLIEDSEEEEYEEDSFGSWGSNDEDEIIETDDQDEEDYEEDSFGSWGSQEEDEEPIINDEDDDYEEDTFGSWGNSEDDEEPISNNEDYSDEEYEDDTFGSWGSDEESSSNCEDLEGDAFGSWGGSSGTSTNTESIRTGGTIPKAKKSKIEYEIESNEKTAKVIEKIANGLFSKGSLFKSKMVDKIKNMDENSD